MSSLDSLPADQRAVLQLVLSRGRSYDEIARLLSIQTSAVRERAQAALDTIGPHTDVPPEDQQQVADYLLGQLSDADALRARDLLADSPGARAWARVVASELAPLTGDKPLPEIPAERQAPRETAEPVAAPTPAADATEKKGRRRRRRDRDEAGEDGEAPVGAPRSSRLGGALVILAVVVAVAAGLFFVLRGGHSKGHGASTSSTSSTTTAPAASATTPTAASSTTSSGTSASVVAQINLAPPATAKQSKAAGIAEVLNEGSTDGVAIVAQNVPPNKTKPPNAYAVWLYNSPQDAKILGFVNPGVGKTGRLSTAGGLPTNASHYKHLIVTVETTASPKTPGTIILQGDLTKV